MKICDILSEIEILSFSGSMDTEINKIAYDSRVVEEGDVFVCIKGYKTDGHKFAKMAEEKGAKIIVAMEAVCCEKADVIIVSDTRLALALMAKAYFNNPMKKKALVGVTGTNGKTTVTNLFKTIYEATGKVMGLIGTNNNMIGDEVFEAERTTPESLELYELFDYMAGRGADGVVMEVSSHALELKRVGGCEFETAVFTNLTQDHLDFHETMENYFAAKSKLFDMCKNAVINIDDEYGKRLKPDCKVYSYGIENDKADLNAKNISISAKGIVFDLEYEKNIYKTTLCIPGKFSVYNALAAIGAAISLGVCIEDAVAAIATAKGVKGRAELVETNRDFSIIIDYAHTPDGLENIISTINEFKRGRAVTLFGCGGDRDRTKRPKMGEVAGRLSDFVIVTSDNPRTEKPSAIIEDIMPGVIKTNCDYVVVENRKDAIKWAIDNAKMDDIIILAGKGHETYQILNDGVIHFDEREVVRDILNSEKNKYNAKNND